MARKTPSLADLLTLADWGPRQLVHAINEKLSSQGRQRLRLDPTAGYPWIKHGFCPRAPIPDVAAAALSDRLGFRVSSQQLWPGHTALNRTVSSAVDGLDALTHLDDLVGALQDLTTVSLTPSDPIQNASGAELTATVDQLGTAMLVPRSRSGHDRLLREQVDLIADHVSALRRLDDRHGGGALSLRYVTTELRNVVDLFEHANFDLETGRRLLTLIGDLAQLLGWLHFDSGRHGSAERYLLLAVGVCRALDARDRSANAIGMLSYVSAFGGNGRHAVRLAEAASGECGEADDVLLARLLGREATAAAAADGDVMRFRRCADTAADILVRSKSQGTPSFLYYLTPTQLAAETGQGFVMLARATTSNRVRLLSEGIELLDGAVTDLVMGIGEHGPAYARSGLLHATFLAEAQLLLGDLSKSIAVLETGLRLLPLVQSPRTRAYLRALRPVLARRSRSRVVRDFLPAFDAALSRS